MAHDDEGRTDVPSTNWAWKRTKIKTPPAGHGTVRAKRGRWYGLARWPRTRTLSLKIRYRGGAESWWLIEARGRYGVFPGYLCIEDIMVQILNEPGFAGDSKTTDLMREMINETRDAGQGCPPPNWNDSVH